MNNDAGRPATARAARSVHAVANDPTDELLREEVIDFVALRARGSPAEREAVARRIFAVWQPVFSHLDDKNYRFHLEKHVEDASAVQMRGLFGIDATGRDRALIIVRVHEHVIGSRTWARLTVNAGNDPSLVQRNFGQIFLIREVWRYRLRHALRRFFVIDCAVSAASYCVYEKNFVGLAPAPGRPIPAAWWPLAELGAAALGGAPVSGAAREVRRFGLRVRDVRPRRDPSPRARRAMAFFAVQTRDTPDSGLLVMAPLDFLSWSFDSGTYVARWIARRLGLRVWL